MQNGNMNRPSEPQSKAASSRSVFDWVEDQHRFLATTLDQLLIDPNPKTISRCLYLSHRIQRACNEHSESILAALQLNRVPLYRTVKEVFAAVLCELMGQKVGLAPSARLVLMCAAQTQDLGMLDLQDSKLDKQAAGLTDGQKRMVQKHPRIGRDMLEKAGVKDASWLKIVEQHHERNDGQGYPKGVTGEEICLQARILAVVDRYVALVYSRGDRDAYLPKQAMKRVFLARGGALDADCTRVLVETLGMNPPGSWVRLFNNEIGVVVGAGASLGFPRVSVILSAEGEHLPDALPRDTSQKAFHIIEMIQPPFHFNLGGLLAPVWAPIPATL
jgi:HD-GYP domain-containing protein (c-di-GMP phosphodiesterase class II)